MLSVQSTQMQNIFTKKSKIQILESMQTVVYTLVSLSALCCLIPFGYLYSKSNKSRIIMLENQYKEQFDSGSQIVMQSILKFESFL